MYLYIFEDGEIKTSTTFGEDERNYCDTGVLTVIDLSTKNPKQYYDGDWHDVESIDG